MTNKKTNLSGDNHIHHLLQLGQWLPITVCVICGMESSVLVGKRHALLNKLRYVMCFKIIWTDLRRIHRQASRKPCVFHTIGSVINRNNLLLVATIMFFDPKINRRPTLAVKIEDFLHVGTGHPFLIVVDVRDLPNAL